MWRTGCLGQTLVWGEDMPLLFSEVPVLLQLLPGLDRGVVVGVNRVGQMLVVAAGVMAIYQEQFLMVFLQWLRATATVLRLLAAGVGWSWSKRGAEIVFPRLLTDKKCSNAGDTPLVHREGPARMVEFPI